MIAIVGICKNEIDIIDLWLQHHIAEGVDHFYIADASNDSTREILEANNAVTVFVDDDQFVQQSRWTNHLASIAANDGAEWICPTDIDEFAYANSGDTIAMTLRECQFDKRYLRCWPHKNWQIKYEAPHQLPKVVYRYCASAQVTVGNHDVSLSGGEYNVLSMRELQYRSFEHFVNKTRARNDVVSPQDKSSGIGWHHTRREHMTDDEMRHEWEVMQSRPTVHDPVPSRLKS